MPVLLIIKLQLNDIKTNLLLFFLFNGLFDLRVALQPHVLSGTNAHKIVNEYLLCSLFTENSRLKKYAQLAMWLCMR